jgi:hypothetical protein
MSSILEKTVGCIVVLEESSRQSYVFHKEGYIELTLSTRFNEEDKDLY